MSRIAIPGRDDAPLEAQPILDNVKKILGFVPNLQRLMSISPNALAGWAGLMGSLSKTLDVKTREVPSRRWLELGWRSLRVVQPK
jgi:hypothetical protein